MSRSVRVLFAGALALLGAASGMLMAACGSSATTPPSGSDAAVTDAKGQFSFPSVVRSSFLGSFLPHEPMVQQTILIQHQGQTYKAWMYDRGSYQDLGELKGKPIVLKCDLDAPLSHKSGIYGICEIV